MSYAEIKPQYYRMHQPDSPWHAGSPGWSTAPWPSFMPNPNLVGPPRLAVEGLGAYFKPAYDRAIAGAGVGACPCAARGVGDGADPLTTNSGAVRMDVIVPVAIIGVITGLAVWVSFKK